MSEGADDGMGRLLALPTEGRLMEKPELIARLGISQRTLEEIQAEGHLPVIKLGRLVRYEWRAVMEELRAKFGVGYEIKPGEAAGS